MIVGIGIDVVDIPRFERQIARTPRLLQRLFTASERTLRPRSLAARYAAKEALIKALGGSDGVHWSEMEITPDASGRPWFRLTGATADTVVARGVGTVHVSLSHDADVAVAYVVAESGPADEDAGDGPVCPAGVHRRPVPEAPRRGAGVLREAVIDTAAISANVRHLRAVLATDVMAVVKADGYGHGAVRSARAALAGGAARLGVTDVAEALQLRAAGIDAPILSWLHAPGADFTEAVAAHVTLGISRLDQLHAAAAAASADNPAVVHLKLETGLGRNGIAPADWPAVCAEAARLERDGRVRVEGVFSHLSNTSPDDDRAALQRFLVGEDAAVAAGLRPTVRHLAATQAALSLPEARLDCVRLGIGVYGLPPTADMTAADLGLRPAMTLRAAVVAVRRVPAGQGVSYGYTYRTARPTTLALVPVGYADGLPRQASGRGPVVIDGRRFTVSGRIAMDQFVVDVGDTPVQVGDEAVLFGDPARGVPSAIEWAEAADTIDYEIVTRIGPRVPRRNSDAGEWRCA